MMIGDSASPCKNFPDTSDHTEVIHLDFNRVEAANEESITSSAMNTPESPLQAGTMYGSNSSGCSTLPIICFPFYCRYDNTPSGWFDGRTFEEWFLRMMMPRLRKQEGKKALIGDNLSSHISVDVLKVCKENNVLFICLPLNATHLCQLLDMAFFGPMKRKW
jgi:hypothetical protein